MGGRGVSVALLDVLEVFVVLQVECLSDVLRDSFHKPLITVQLRYSTLLAAVVR